MGRVLSSLREGGNVFLEGDVLDSWDGDFLRMAVSLLNVQRIKLGNEIRGSR